MVVRIRRKMVMPEADIEKLLIDGFCGIQKD